MSLLVSAILSLLLLPNGHPVAHARHYVGGAREKASTLAEHVDQAAKAYDIDPLLLVALAHSETGLDGTRVGELGEVGLMQFMPHSRAGRAYARAQGSQPERDGVAIILGAEALREGLRACGSEAAAIGHYKSGRCQVGPRARAVIALRNRLGGRT